MIRKSPFLRYSPAGLAYCFFCLYWLLVTAACSTPHKKQDHAAYFDSVLNSMHLYTYDLAEYAFHRLDSIYSTFPNPGPLDLAKKYNYKLDHYWLGQHNISKSNLYIDSILHILEDSKTEPASAKLYGLALLCQGDILRDEQKFSQAISNYFQGEEYIEKTGDTCMFNEFDMRIAMVYYRQKKYADAVPYFREAFLNLNACRQDSFYRFHYQQGMLDNIGLSFQKIARKDSALFYYDSALHYIQLQEPFLKGVPKREMNMQVSKAVIYGNKGELLFSMGDTTYAENLYKTSIGINQQIGAEVGDAQATMIKLVTLLLAQKRYGEARLWLDKLKSSIDSFPDIQKKTGWMQLQSKYYELNNQPSLALSYINSFLHTRDSLENIYSPLNSVNTRQQFDFLEKDYEFKLLKKQDEIKTAYLIISMLLFVLAIGFILQVWYNAKKAKAQAKKLQRMNDTITRQNEVLEESLSSLEQSHQSNSKMMRIIVHDLRNPVGAIIPLSDLLYYSGEITDKENLEVTTLIKESASRAMMLINELMHLNISSDDHKERLELHTVIQYCVELLQQKAREKEQRIYTSLCPAIITGDREKLWRVFSNLITNAIKFSNRGGVIYVDMQCNAERVSIAIQDDGIGIPDALKEDLFNLSETIKRQGTSGEESFGLGLFICKQIVDTHGGKIWVESIEGKGATFWVELPLQKS